MATQNLSTADDDNGLVTAAERLVEARKRAGFQSGREAALTHGFAPSTFSAHENGTRKIPRKAAEAYAIAFNVTPDWIMRGAEPRSIGGVREVAFDGFPDRTAPIYATMPINGTQFYIREDEPSMRLAMPPKLARVRHCYGVVIPDDANAPRWKRGEIAWINPHVPPGLGHDALVRIKDNETGLIRAVIMEVTAIEKNMTYGRQYGSGHQLEFERELFDIQLIAGREAV